MKWHVPHATAKHYSEIRLAAQVKWILDQVGGAESQPRVGGENQDGSPRTFGRLEDQLQRVGDGLTSQVIVAG